MGNKQPVLTHKEEALLYATRRGCVDIVNNLINQNININIRDEYNNTPLIHICSLRTIGNKEHNDKYSIIKKLLTCKANPNDMGYGKKTALICALNSGYYNNKTINIVTMLLDNNADPNIKDIDNNTPLKLAIDHGLHDVVIEILKRQKPENIVKETSNALNMATIAQKPDVISAILNFNVEPIINSQNNISESLIIDSYQNIISESSIINPQNNNDMNDIILCPICITDKRNTIFQCGHSSCLSCSNKISNCMNCRVKILSRNPMFL
jgi:ankyrin repeat protein